MAVFIVSKIVRELKAELFDLLSHLPARERFKFDLALVLVGAENAINFVKRGVKVYLVRPGAQVVQGMEEIPLIHLPALEVTVDTVGVNEPARVKPLFHVAAQPGKQD
jgi:hypothetical protein